MKLKKYFVFLEISNLCVYIMNAVYTRFSTRFTYFAFAQVFRWTQFSNVNLKILIDGKIHEMFSPTFCRFLSVWWFSMENWQNFTIETHHLRLMHEPNKFISKILYSIYLSKLVLRLKWMKQMYVTVRMSNRRSHWSTKSETMVVCDWNDTYSNVFEFDFRRANPFDWIWMSDTNSAKLKVIFTLKFMKFVSESIENIWKYFVFSHWRKFSDDWNLQIADYLSMHYGVLVHIVIYTLDQYQFSVQRVFPIIFFFVSSLTEVFAYNLWNGGRAACFSYTNVRTFQLYIVQRHYANK